MANYMTTQDGWRVDVEFIDDREPQAFLSKGRFSGSLTLAEMEGEFEDDDGTTLAIPASVVHRARLYQRSYC